MRIASLVPSATEMLFALGLGQSVVAVTHECDFPPEAAELPRLTRSVIPAGLPAAEVDAAVRERTGRGEALYELDDETLAELGVDLVVTQALCAVCAVSYDDVRALAARLPTRPRILSLDPGTLDEVLADIGVLATATGVPEAGQRLLAALRARLEAIGGALRGANDRPRVAALEWLDPPYLGGHWVPEMIARAGGIDPLGEPGRDSRAAGWDEIAAARPEVVVAMPCGMNEREAGEQVRAQGRRARALEARSVFAVDAAASFSRPGPRLVDGVELLAHLLHPDLVDPPPGIGWLDLTDELEWDSTAPSARSR